MARILSLSLRPRTLSGLYGQEDVVKSIRQHIATRPPNVWLLHGPSGTGKTTAARIMAVAYQCSHMKLWGDPCEECWKARAGFAIHEINASETSGVEDMGKLADISRIRPMGCAKRVIITDEMQRATSASQNLLLKPFEDPPTTTIWIVCTTDPGKILSTLRRRCVTYQLKPLGFDASERFLQRAASIVKIAKPLPPLYEQVHLAGIGSPALLLMALEKFAAGSSAEEAVSGTDGVSINSLRICKAVTDGNWKVVRDSLANATKEEARWITASVAGWIRGIMIRDSTPSVLDKAALSLYDLSVNVPFEDDSRILWLWPVLYKITKRYSIR
jgi:hypothetical protein